MHVCVCVCVLNVRCNPFGLSWHFGGGCRYAQVGVTLPPNTGGILTPASQLLPKASSVEILELMKTILDKCSTQITLQLLEVSERGIFTRKHKYGGASNSYTVREWTNDKRCFTLHI